MSALRGMRPTGDAATDHNFDMIRRMLEGNIELQNLSPSCVGNRPDQISKGAHVHEPGTIDMDPLAIMTWDND
ncbi:MAG: hypothetical protein ACREEP_13775 [Dongiaceae bacterium]